MVILIVIAVILGLIIFLVAPTFRKHPDREALKGLRIAHRGLHSVYDNTPENSIPAFKKAIEHSVAIETDVHITKDNKLVVFHDDNLKRMCSLDAKPEDLTLEELTKLKLGGTEFTIPSFEEFLKLVDGRVPLMIELKTRSSKTCNRLCSAVDKAMSGYNGKYFIQSFYPFAVAWYRKNNKQVLRGQLSSGYFDEKTFVMKLLSFLMFNFIGRPDFVSYEAKHHKNIFRKISVALGAFSVGWTFKSDKQIDELKDEFSAYIFEGFIPKK